MTQGLTTIAVHSQHRRISSEPPDQDSDQHRRASGNGPTKFEVHIEMKPLVEADLSDVRMLPNGLGDDAWPCPRSAAVKEVGARATNL